MTTKTQLEGMNSAYRKVLQRQEWLLRQLAAHASKVTLGIDVELDPELAELLLAYTGLDVARKNRASIRIDELIERDS